MSSYAQNNFKDSAIAKEGKGNKALIIVTLISTLLMIAAFKHAIGG
jgi:hypothetical protein